MSWMIRCALTCGALFSASAVSAAPAHYVVLELDAAGYATPLFYREVDLALPADPIAPATVPKHGTDGGVPVVVAGYGKSGLVARQHWYGDRMLRSEGVDAQGRLTSQVVKDAAPVVVARLPASADTLELTVHGHAQRIDLKALAATQKQLPLAAFAEHAPVVRKTTSGNPANRVDLLVTGDGFTAAQSAAFANEAAALRTGLFSITPYDEYVGLVNWTTLFVASTDAGADHPQNCTDPAINNDPLRGQVVNTAFDATFCAFNIHRLLVVSNAKVFAAAAAAPDWDTILVLVNDTTYGGSGGQIPVGSTNTFAQDVMIHEYGHSFAGLADEYEDAYPGFPACSDLGPNPTCEANVTNQTNAAQVKWASWFTAGLPIPTPEGSGHAGVGLFAGARYLASGMYRPTESACMMRSLGNGFCPVCAQEYILTLYRGGFGVPAGGIDLIEPGTESPSNAGTVTVSTNTTQRFQATVLRPTGQPLAFEWRLDGQLVATTETYDFSPMSATPSTRTLQLQVTDGSALLKAQMVGSLHRHTRSWSLSIVPGAPNARVFYSGFETP